MLWRVFHRVILLCVLLTSVMQTFFFSIISATKNVTRVYWEHNSKPIIPKAFEIADKLSGYVTMSNHHQGMFIATQSLLRAWKKRPGCQFDIIRRRPGAKNNPSQPSEGTQRVWMSSHMLHGKKHCNVQQVIPIDNFGKLNVLHLPNKNYRRVGKQGRLGGSGSKIENEFGTGKEEYAGASSELLTAMQCHLIMKKTYQDMTEGKQYVGIKMFDEIDYGTYITSKHKKLVNKLMHEFDEYVARGGIMSDSDITNWDWLI